LTVGPHTKLTKNIYGDHAKEPSRKLPKINFSSYLEEPARIEAQHDLKILSKPKTKPNSGTDYRYSNY
jgi:hypothetical protein